MDTFHGARKKNFHDFNPAQLYSREKRQAITYIICVQCILEYMSSYNTDIVLRVDMVIATTKNWPLFLYHG